MTTEELLARHPEAWRAATRHPFLEAVRDGTLPACAFAAWLGQDYLFVGDLLSFQARLLARAPRHAQAVLAGGMVALEAELGWFEEHAARRSLELVEERHATTEAYRRFMGSLDGQPFAAALTALWALERAYMEGWGHASPGAPEYRPFVEHWTVPEFAGYVAGLGAAADRALAVDDSGAEAAFLETARLEAAFWEMAWGRPGP